MNFKEYQQLTHKTAQYPMRLSNMVYPALKLAGEAGELADKIGKHWRNETAKQGNNYMGESTALKTMAAASMSPELKGEIIKEMGDVLWYLAALSDELGICLSTVAQVNIEKTHDRLKRGVICSEGDNR